MTKGNVTVQGCILTSRSLGLVSDSIHDDGANTHFSPSRTALFDAIIVYQLESESTCPHGSMFDVASRMGACRSPQTNPAMWSRPILEFVRNPPQNRNTRGYAATPILQPWHLSARNIMPCAQNPTSRNHFITGTPLACPTTATQRTVAVNAIIMAAEKRPASNAFGSSQLVVKRQKSNIDLSDGRAVAVTNGNASGGALIQAVSR